MHIRDAFTFGLLLIIVSSAGCLSDYSTPPATPVPAPAVAQTTNPSSTIPASAMALQLADIPQDYTLKDRSVIAYEELDRTAKDLGWMEGYRVSFYRLNIGTGDMSMISQTIGIYPWQNMNDVMTIQKDAMGVPSNDSVQYEIPFPRVGDSSIAYRATGSNDPSGLVTYTVIFMKKNVFEKIIMTGTTTDYEVLKDVAGKAADKIR